MDPFLREILRLVREAGAKILAIYRGPFTVSYKADASLLTQADLLSEQIIKTGLARLTPAWPLLSEESELIAFNTRRTWNPYWLLDPLDGTRDFVEKTDEFTLNLALIENHQPLLGIIYVPVLKCCYFAYRRQGAFKQIEEGEIQPIHTQTYYPNTPLRIVGSRQKHPDLYQSFFDDFFSKKVTLCGSSLKFGWLAEGKADAYLRLTPSSEWDTAAGQCILEEAGGQMIGHCSNQTFQYNCRLSLENGPFLAVGDIQYHKPFLKTYLKKVEEMYEKNTY